MEPLRIHSRLVLPPEELDVRFSRSGGPGGQNVNKVETRVELRFSVAESAALGDNPVSYTHLTLPTICSV